MAAASAARPWATASSPRPRPASTRACDRVQPGADAGQAEGRLPHLGGRGEVGLAPAAAAPVELGPDHERDREQEEPAGRMGPAHHDVEQPLGPVPVLQREIGEQHQAEHVLGVREVALDERLRELRERGELFGHARVRGEQPAFDARRARRRRRSARPRARRIRRLASASATASSMSSANTATFTAYVSRRVARSGSIASIVSAASTRICAPFSGPARYVSS